MSQVQDNFTVCNQCGGAIPSSADKIRGVNGTLILSGNETGFATMDFCCSAHLVAWIQAQPQVATPSPLYNPPPVL